MDKDLADKQPWVGEGIDRVLINDMVLSICIYPPTPCLV